MTEFPESRQKSESLPNSGVEVQVFEPGQILGAKYKIVSPIGQGGMGVVYRVRQVFLDKEFALKTLVSALVSDVSIRRFQIEAKAATSLNHPNLVQVHDFGVLDETQQPYLVMDYVDGMSLADHLRKVGTMPVEQAGPMFAQICLGLGYAHEQGIVHRDIKPGNIMLVNGMPWGSEGSVKVVDFGIAKLLSSDDGKIQALTRTGEIFGSPLYMSPEQCSGATVDRRTDVYSVGCVIYEALTGAQPHLGQTALTTMMMHQSDVPLSLREASLGKEFPQSIERIVTRMLQKDPNDRYQNLSLVAHELGRVFEEVSGSRKGAPRKPTKASHAIVVSLTKMYVWLSLTAIVSAVTGAAVMFFAFQNKGGGSSLADTSAADVASKNSQGNAKSIDAKAQAESDSEVSKTALEDEVIFNKVKPIPSRNFSVTFPERSIGLLFEASDGFPAGEIAKAAGQVNVELVAGRSLGLEIPFPRAEDVTRLSMLDSSTKSKIEVLQLGVPVLSSKRSFDQSTLRDILRQASSWPNLQAVNLLISADETVIGALANFKNLRNLMISYPRASAEAVSRLPSLSRVEKITVCGVQTDPIVRQLGRLGRVKSLVLENGMVTADALVSLNKCHSLKEVMIVHFSKKSRRNIDDASIQAIAGLSGLRSISFIHCDLAVPQIRTLCNSAGIRTINIVVPTQNPSVEESVRKFDYQQKVRFASEPEKLGE